MRLAVVTVLALVSGPVFPRPAEHPGPGPDPTDRKTLAVLYFDNNTGDRDYDALGRGIAAMMITDLSAVDEVQLVEREHLDELLQEMERQRTKYFDSTTAVEVGRLAGSQYVVAGSLAALKPAIRMDTRVIRVETGQIVKTGQATGKEDKFFDLQEELARELVDGLAIALSPEDAERLRARQEANRIDRLATLNAYSQALALYDRGDYVGAAEQMRSAGGGPNSLMLRSMSEQIGRKTTDKAKTRLRDRINGAVKLPRF